MRDIGEGDARRLTDAKAGERAFSCGADGLLVSVIVPHYNAPDALALCLDRLERQTLPRERYEIVVADNQSPQGKAAIEAVIRGRARLVIVEERGAGPARNGGVQASRGEVLAFTDSDCQPESDWLERGLESLLLGDLVGGRVRVSVADPDRMTAAEAFERVFAFDAEDYITRKRFSVTANLFCRRAAFDRVGPFRVGVSEDVDWSHRALAEGFSLTYESRAVIWHPARRSWTELAAKWRRMNRESFALFGEGARARLRWMLKAALLPVSAVVHSPRIFTSRELATPKQRLLALGMLFRLRFWRSWDAWRIMFASNGRC
jgi:glycosyltransferase involved in cell wall biosynthesis